jgi:Ni,Fe-hydrogenase I cytochrome b subunit
MGVHQPIQLLEVLWVVLVFMILTGLAFFLLGKDLEKLSKGVEKAVAEKAKEAK